MILTTNQILEYIPFRHLDRTQVAELMNKSLSTVDKYSREGIKVCEGMHLQLRREKNGKFRTVDVLDFINKKNKYESC
jgi:hypothetical protein